jgi:hypothetical protein
MLRTPEENRRLLEAAGYAWDDQRDAWVHPKTRRELDGRIARGMTEEQLTAWLKAGAGRPSMY